MLARFMGYFVIWFIATIFSTIGFVAFIGLLGAQEMFTISDMLVGTYYIGPYVVIVTGFFTFIVVTIIELIIYFRKDSEYE